MISLNDFFFFSKVVSSKRLNSNSLFPFVAIFFSVQNSFSQPHHHADNNNNNLSTFVNLKVATQYSPLFLSSSSTDFCALCKQKSDKWPSVDWKNQEKRNLTIVPILLFKFVLLHQQHFTLKCPFTRSD